MSDRQKELLSDLVKQGSLKEVTGDPAYLPAERPAFRRKGVPRWVLLLSLAILWHVALFMILQPVTSSGVYRAPRGTRLSLLTGTDAPGTAGPVSREARAMWSPILLSLPSPMGFSGSVGAPGPRIAPDLNLPREEILFLEPSDMQAVRRVGGQAWARVDRQSTARLAEPPAGTAGRGTRLLTPPREVPVHLAVLSGGDPGLLRVQDWPVQVMQKTTRPWDAVLRFRVGEDGAVEDVLLEKRTEDRILNEDLVRLVYEWNLPQDAASSVYRVQFRCYGRPALAGTARGDSP